METRKIESTHFIAFDDKVTIYGILRYFLGHFIDIKTNQMFVVNNFFGNKFT